MAWDKGFNFRATAVFVTDGTNETYVTEDGSNGANQYPITRNGVTFGYQTGIAGGMGTRDRNAALDRRLAGTHFPNSGNSVASKKFRIDLPAAGTYTIQLALGDASSSRTGMQFDIYDNTTNLGTITGNTTATNLFLDAQGTALSPANWPGSNVAISKTFASTIFNLDIGNTATAGTSFVAHIFLSQVASGGRLFKTTALNGLGGTGQQQFNSSLAGY